MLTSNIMLIIYDDSFCIQWNTNRVNLLVKRFIFNASLYEDTLRT